MKTTYRPLSWILAIPGFFVSLPIGAFGGPTTGEIPVHSSLTSLGEIGLQNFGIPNFVGVGGGVAVESDAAGNYFHATGPTIAKYDSAGVLLWSQTQSPYVFTVQSGELTQNTYFDRWTDDHGQIDDIQLGSGFYKGDLASCFAQEIVLDASGDVYVDFLDTQHRDRSVVAKFDGTTGDVEWVARTGDPSEEDASSRYISTVVGFFVLPDHSVALMETGAGSSGHAFTRFLIFGSEGTSQNGVPLVTKNRVFYDDGGTSFRMSIGVGMDVAADGTIYYATYEGADPLQENPPLDYYPAPISLVLRKLAAPYTGNPTEVPYTTSQTEGWNDLEIGPGGTIYTLGSTVNVQNRREPTLAGFEPVGFTVTVTPRTYTSPDFLRAGIRELPGVNLFATGTEADDSLYITTGELDQFRDNPYLDSHYSYYSATAYPMFVTKVDSAGTILWQKHDEYELGVYSAFVDSLDNLYFVGYNYETPGASFYKYSPSGRLQVAYNLDAVEGNVVDGRFTGLIDADGDIVVAFPQGTPSAGNSSRLARFTNPPNIEGPSIDFPEFTSSAYPGEVLTLSATASNGQPVFFHITFGEDIAYISGNSLVLLRPGLISVQAFQQSGSGFIYSETRLLAVYKRPQTITFPKVNPPKFKKKNQRFLLNATSTSGQPITYTSSSSAIKISGNVAIMRKEGKADITASQAGDSIYLPAQPVVQQVKVK